MTGEQPEARPANPQINTATAPNDSQKPVARGAIGSSRSTASNAITSARPGWIERRSSRAPKPAASMTSARRVGSVNPASSA